MEHSCADRCYRSALNSLSGLGPFSVVSSLGGIEISSRPHSRSPSVWTAPLSSQAFISSADPPALANISDQPTFQHTSFPPALHHRSDSSTYYTAQWGSPPSSEAHPARYHRQSFSIISADGSPPRRFSPSRSQTLTPPQGRRIISAARREGQFGFLNSRRRSVIGVRSPLGQAHSRHSFTENWLKNNLADSTNTEKSNWWSDESDNSDKEALGPYQAEESPCSGLTLSRRVVVGSPPAEKLGVRTARSTITREAGIGDSPSSKRTISCSEPRQSTTLFLKYPQESSIAVQPFQHPSALSVGHQTEERPGSHLGASFGMAQDMEKPLPPPPPFARSVSEGPLSSIPAERSADLIRSLDMAHPSLQKARKRVLWRGKACIISLPSIDEGWSHNGSITLLNPQDVDDRLKIWERQGFDTKGFTLTSSADGFLPVISEGQSCAVYPDPGDEEKERAQRDFRVNIPDRREWEDYVYQLKENKLRALGVSFADEESSARNSPVLPLMSRHASSQSSAIPLSPPLTATSMANSHPLQRLNPLSMSFHAPTNSVAHNSILYNGTQPLAKPGVSKFSRYTIPPSSMEKVLPPYQFPPAQSPLPGSWSPQQFIRSHPSSRVTSPGVNGHMQSFVSPLPPPAISSPDHDGHAGHALHQISNNTLPYLRPQQAQTQAQLLQQSLRQQQQLPDPRFHQMTSNQNIAQQSQHSDYQKQPDIITPIPRGHRQNLSETLQKEVDDAEKSPDQKAGREGRKPDEYEAEEKSLHRDELPVLANILQRVDKDLDVDDSDLETNPSLSNTPKPCGTRPEHNHQSHEPKPSLSRLNVNAPEFVYEPNKTNTPDVFAFLGNQQKPKPPSDSKPLTSESPKHASKFSINGSIFNVTAPAFTPTNFTKPAAPSRVFSFSSSGPTFESDAPSFKTSSIRANSASPVIGSNESNGGKIFGEINFTEIVKPSRKSKAIPIVRPLDDENASGQDIDGQEDESGRITQADGRQKRLRRSDDDGDQIPLFATPDFKIPTHVEDLHRTDLPKFLDSDSNNQADSRKSEMDGDQPENLNGLSDSEVSSLLDDHEARDTNRKSWEPFTFEDAQDAAMFNTARPVLPSPTDAASDDMAHGTQGGDQKIPSPTSEGHSSTRLVSGVIRDVEHDSLPASADIPEYDTSRTLSGASLGKLADDNPSPLDKKGSRSSQSSIHSGSCDSTKKQEASEGHQRGESSLVDKVSHHKGVAVYLEQSYNEIDAVMKHLNDEDSDLGVERNVNPWTHRSPIGTPFMDLQNTSGVQPLLPPPHDRSNAPSPSPNRLQQVFQYPPNSDSESVSTAEVERVARNARFSPSYRPSKGSLDSDNPVHRLNSPGDLPVSDWDDVLSSTDEVKFQSRAVFFDHRINNLVGGIVQQHLRPLERLISGIESSLATLSGRSASRRHRRSTSSREIENSDADDEDDQRELMSIVTSPVKDRRYDKLKASVAELSAAQQNLPSASEISELMKAINDLTSMVPGPAQPLGEIRTVVQEAVANQLRGKSGAVMSSQESATAEKLQLQIAGLESMLKIADARADDELKARRHTEDALADNQRLLRIAMQEAAEQRESAEETERSLAAFHDEKQHVLRRTAMLEGAQESLQKSVADLNEKNDALESTLEEYRLSSSQWRKEVESAKMENQDLRRTINALKVEIEDNIRGRQTLRTKFDRLQEDMTLASRDIARDQSIWRKREEENKARLEILNERLESESKIREMLEQKIVGLVAQERETTNLQQAFEQSQQENLRMDRLIDELRAESKEYQKNATRSECELLEVRESARLEVKLVSASMKGEIATANNELKNARSDLELFILRHGSEIENAASIAASEKARYEAMLEDATNNAASSKAKYEALLEEATSNAAAAKVRYAAMLEEASESRNIALREAAEAREAALQEHYRFHERTLEDLKAVQFQELKNIADEKQQSEKNLNDRLSLTNEKIGCLEHKLKELKSQHDHQLKIALEAKEHAESHASDRLELANEKLRHLEQSTEELKVLHKHELKTSIEEKERAEIHAKDRLSLADQRVLHLEDKVTHLHEMLEIAKTAAQQLASQSKKFGPSPSATRASISLSTNPELPERISPQALRESIMVLQEQLQEREVRIEQLEQEQTTIDRDAPAKLKDREMEVTWLRELLGVRIDDLEDIITTVSQPHFNRDAVKDAAIRLKANLQMEQQEKERAIAGGQNFPSLASIAASPRALPLAAAAAWGNWRKGRDSSRSFGSLTTVASGSPSQTPSRFSPSTSQGFLSGLLTPPGTNIRQTPQQHGPSSRPVQQTASSNSKRPAPGSYRTPHQSIFLRDDTKPLELLPEAPVTPRLMRKASYDGDAEVTMGFGEDIHEGPFFAQDGREDGRSYEPFGPDIGTVSGDQV